MSEYSKLNDIELYSKLRGTHEEKEAAFNELYSRYSNQIYRYCRRILCNEALCEDIYQETFLKFLQSAEKEKEMTNVFAYLLKIARNLCLNAQEKKVNSVPLDNIEVVFEDTQYEKAELSKLVAMALELLNDQYREALVLQTYNDMSYEEISETLEVPVSTVRNWVVRAKKKVREILTPYLEDYQNN